MSSLSWQRNDCSHSTPFVGKKDERLRGSWTAAKVGSEFLQRGPERVKVMPLLQWRCKDTEDVSSVGCPQEVKLCSAAGLQGELYGQQQSWKGEAASITCQTVS